LRGKPYFVGPWNPHRRDRDLPSYTTNLQRHKGADTEEFYQGEEREKKKTTRLEIKYNLLDSKQRVSQKVEMGRLRARNTT